MTRRSRCARPGLADRLLVPVATMVAALPCAAGELRLLRDVHLADGRKASLLVRDAWIEAVLDGGAAAPPGARVVDAHDALALPAFIDVYSFAGCATPQPEAVRDVAPHADVDVLVDMRAANRKGILASFRAADAFKSEAESDKRYRASGFGAWLSAPHGELLCGTSALVTASDAAPRDRIRAPLVLDHAGFSATGPGYPGSTMGAVAQLRQFFLDAAWVSELERRNADGRRGIRAPWDTDLAAIRPVLEKKRRLACEADTVAEIDRWIALSDELGFDIAISGGSEAWRRADVLAKRRIPVLLTLHWGEEVDDPHAKPKPSKSATPAANVPKRGAPDVSAESSEHETVPDASKSAPSAQDPAAKQSERKSERPDDRKPAVQKPEDVATPKETAKPPANADEKQRWIYEAPLRVREEQRRLWEEKRDCALRLQEAGVAYAFGTGKDAPKELLEHVRTLVEHGLSAADALHALTDGAAELLGIGKDLGRIAPGCDATFALWSADPLVDEDARVVWLFVDGEGFEFELDSNALKGRPDEGVDATGTWELEFSDSDVQRATIELVMTRAGSVKGTLRYRSPVDDSELTGAVEGRVAGKKLRLTGRVKAAKFESEVTIEGEIDGAHLTGTTAWKWSGGTSRFESTRMPRSEHHDEHADQRDAHDDPHAGGERR